MTIQPRVPFDAVPLMATLKEPIARLGESCSSPRLTPEHLARVSARGRRRAVAHGEILIEAGQEHFPFFVVTDGQLETAIGDVRSGNIKRVASAVGEGSIAVAFVHQFLRE